MPGSSYDFGDGSGDYDYGNASHELDEDIIPGDNDKVLPPSPLTNPGPDNMTHIPSQGGDIPIEQEPQKP